MPPVQDRKAGKEARLDPRPRQELLHPPRRRSGLDTLEVVILGDGGLRENRDSLGRVAPMEAEHHDLLVELEALGELQLPPPRGLARGALDDARIGVGARPRLDSVEGPLRVLLGEGALEVWAPEERDVNPRADEARQGAGQRQGRGIKSV